VVTHAVYINSPNDTQRTQGLTVSGNIFDGNTINIWQSGAAYGCILGPNHYFDGADELYGTSNILIDEATGNFTELRTSADIIAGANLKATGFLQKTEANGQALSIKSLTELTTIAAAAFTDTAIEIPANTITLGVSVRVTVIIPTAATFTVAGASGTPAAFHTGASVAVAAGTTNVGNTACPYLNATAQKIRITPNASPADNTGRVRVTIHYIDITPATS